MTRVMPNLLPLRGNDKTVSASILKKNTIKYYEKITRRAAHFTLSFHWVYFFHSLPVFDKQSPISIRSRNQSYQPQSRSYQGKFYHYRKLFRAEQRLCFFQFRLKALPPVLPVAFPFSIETTPFTRRYPKPSG